MLRLTVVYVLSNEAVTLVYCSMMSEVHGCSGLFGMRSGIEIYVKTYCSICSK